jgi:hypothetical protein
VCATFKQEKIVTMPVICNTVTVATKLSENLTLGFKSSEKENYEVLPIPSVQQVLSARIEYEEVSDIANSTLNSLQSKYILLQPNQLPTTLANGECLKKNLPVFSICNAVSVQKRIILAKIRAPWRLLLCVNDSRDSTHSYQ